LARIDACAGDLDAAESTARKGLESARHLEEPFVEMQYLSVLAFIAFLRADHHAVLAFVDALPERIAAMGLVDPGLYRFEQVLLESHIALGNRTRADSLVRELESRAAKIGSGWAVAASLWCRGLFLAATDDFPKSLDTLEKSVAAFEELDQPFELGRGLLTLGQTQRRARRKTAARGSLDRASTIFSALGATAWAAKATDETARIGGRPPSRWELTPTESRVAALVATGRTNREVAEELVVSPKTVEWTLSNVYRKLQVHSRTALAERIHSTKRS
jgi:DNA-binding CsgD family transcriptional regulator